MEHVAHGTAGASRHIYPASAMVGDYLRAAAGLVPSGMLFAAVPISGVAAAMLGSCAAIFAVFGARTALRHATALEMTDTELRASGAWGRTLIWADLDRMKLAYYSTRRDRKSGWMQLELAAGGAKLSLDSRIAGFDRLVRRAAEAAMARRLALGEATIANLEALGVRLTEPEGRP